MKDYIIEKLDKYCQSNDEIRALFYIKEDNNNEHFASVYLIMKDIIIGKIKDDLKKVFDDYVLINKKRDFFKIDKRDQQFTKFEVYTKDSTKVEVSIVHEDLALDFIENLRGSLNFIYDEENIYQNIEKKESLYELPKDYEFEQTSKDFFSLCLDTSFSLLSRDRISAGFKMQEMKNELFKLLNWYIIDKYKGGMDAGDYGKNLVHTLEADLKDDLLEVFSNADSYHTYTAIFKACHIYRKLGMDFAQKHKLTYPKEDDVYSLKLLRKNYKKMESMMA